MRVRVRVGVSRGFILGGFLLGLWASRLNSIWRLGRGPNVPEVKMMLLPVGLQREQVKTSSGRGGTMPRILQREVFHGDAGAEAPTAQRAALRRCLRREKIGLPPMISKE